MGALQVVRHMPGPAWQPDVDFREQPGVDAHYATLKTWLDDGHLVMAGPFLDADGGGMAIVRFADVASAESAAQTDPAVASGLLLATVRPWLAGLSAFDL